jgi:type III restriction enzyme
VAQIFGVPYQIVPFKANAGGVVPPPAKRWHVHSLPGKGKYQIRFPRVEGYTQAIRNRVTVDWGNVPELELDPTKIPPEVDMAAALPTNDGRPSIHGLGGISQISLNPYRAGRRLQELLFDLAQDLTRDLIAGRRCEIPAHALFPQVFTIAQRYAAKHVKPLKPFEVRDAFLSPYYGWILERLTQAIKPDAGAGEIPELPRYETRRGAGSTGDVDFWTSRDVREVVRSHVNFVVADTRVWEQSAAYLIDSHSATAAFVKNAGLGFGIPYVDNGQTHEYLPDFIIRLSVEGERYLIVETKGFDPKEEVKKAAALRWVNAVNAESSFGCWGYEVAKKPSDVVTILSNALVRSDVGGGVAA